jgi:DNA-binding transcriptional ArsR family regulator
MAKEVVVQERVFKALANRRRIAIVAYLKKRKEASVGDIAEAIRLSIKATSKHLAILSVANILEREQRSVQMFYRLASDMPAATRSIIYLL